MMSLVAFGAGVAGGQIAVLLIIVPAVYVLGSPSGRGAATFFSRWWPAISRGIGWSNAAKS